MERNLFSQNVLIDPPLVSITIPTYNAASTLTDTLDSVLAQTYQNIEVIVIDDGSDDNTQEVLRRYGSSLLSIRQDNSGLASARNVGCRAAKGKYIALMDADDQCMPERIAVQVAYMEQNPEIVMCSSDFAAFNKSGLVADSYIANYYLRIPKTTDGIAEFYPHREDFCLAGYEVTTYSGFIYEQMALGSFIHPPTVLFRSSLLEECGFADEQIVNACDPDWLVRMSKVGEIGFITRPLLRYRLSENQLSGPRNRLQLAFDMVQVLEKTIKSDPEIFQRNRTQFRRNLGVCYLRVADTLVDDRPLAAIAKLFRSVAFGVLRWQSMKVVLKAVTPLWVLNWRRARFLNKIT